MGQDTKAFISQLWQEQACTYQNGAVLQGSADADDRLSPGHGGLTGYSRCHQW